MPRGGSAQQSERGRTEFLVELVSERLLIRKLLAGLRGNTTFPLDIGAHLLKPIAAKIF
ncbi:MAG: hypothetical protein IPL35_14970, partial [Sphingobacteriales bacterium]|nr:hypothetical protein [Sphingobacteriales bacterium]